jgi:hypothetical protein
MENLFRKMVKDFIPENGYLVVLLSRFYVFSHSAKKKTKKLVLFFLPSAAEAGAAAGAGASAASSPMMEVGFLRVIIYYSE